MMYGFGVSTDVDIICRRSSLHVETGYSSSLVKYLSQSPRIARRCSEWMVWLENIIMLADKIPSYQPIDQPVETGYLLFMRVNDPTSYCSSGFTQSAIRFADF